jgi:hypothetical protein
MPGVPPRLLNRVGPMSIPIRAILVDHPTNRLPIRPILRIITEALRAAYAFRVFLPSL